MNTDPSPCEDETSDSVAMPTQDSAQALGWYADPMHLFEYRYWDGRIWTSEVATNGVQSTHHFDSDQEHTFAQDVAASATTTGDVTASKGNSVGLKVLGAVILAVLLAFAANQRSLSSAEQQYIAELQSEGLTRSQAECVTQKMIARFGEERALSDDDPTPDEQLQIVSIALQCGVR